MIDWVKKEWLKNLVFVYTSVTLFSCNTLTPQTSQPKQTNPGDSNTSSSEVTPPKQRTEGSNPSSATSASEEVSASPSTQPIPLVITPEEVKLREQQVQIAKEIERLEMNYEKAGLGNRRDTLRETYRRLNSEIQLLQAQQLLQLKQQKEETKK